MTKIAPAATVPRLILDAPSLDGPAGSPTGFDVLFDATPTPILVLDRETLRFLRVNEAALSFYGYSVEEFLALHLPDIRPEKIPGEIEGMIARFDDPTLPDTPRLHLTKAGEWRIVKVNARIIDFGGRPAILAAVFDMTREQELQREARAARSFLRNMVDGLPIAMYAKDAATGEYVFFNSAAEQVLGVSREQIIGRTAAETFGAAEAQVFVEQDRQAREAGQAGVIFESCIPHPERGTRCLWIKKVLINDGEANGHNYIVAVAEDITEERRRSAEIAHLASHDALTGLANRWLFQHHLGEAQRSPAAATPAGDIAVHFIDLDGFKSVNDTWGHPAGDELLVMASARMRAAVRDGDIVARLGGDEFAVLQLGIRDADAARTLAHRLVTALSEPYEIEGQSCRIGASIGICLARPELMPERVVEEADRALYAAKRDGKGRYVLVTP